MPQLPETFRSVVLSIMSSAPNDSRDWQIEEKNGKCTLFIPKLSEEGFEITVEANDSEVTVFSEYLAHRHFTSDGNHEDVSQLAMGLVRDLLSPLMRVRVIELGGKPSRADIEIIRDGQWHRETTTGLFRLPLFRKRTERYYVNRRLPIRG